jgi:hypothetical protein
MAWPVGPLERQAQPTVLPEDKGRYLGSCNRKACLRPGANWFNRETRAYYCRRCAWLINTGNPDIHPPLLTEGENK